MFSQDFARRVLRSLDERIARSTEAVAQGTPPDHASYREMVGYIRGLRHARADLVEPFGKDADLPPSP